MNSENENHIQPDNAPKLCMLKARLGWPSDSKGEVLARLLTTCAAGLVAEDEADGEEIEDGEENA